MAERFDIGTYGDGDRLPRDPEIDDTNVPRPGERNMVLVPFEELEDLRQEAKKLRALEAAGVDSWSGYETAMGAYLADDDG